MKSLLCVLLVASLTLPLTAGRRRGNGGGGATISVTLPHPHQVLQRDANGMADLLVAGTCAGIATGIEASWSGAPFQVIDPDPACATEGTYGGLLPDQPVGQGVLRVRFQGRPAIRASVEPVGVGDVFVIAGQSNAVMAGVNLHEFTHPTLLAGAYTRDQVFKIGSDPIHDSGGIKGSSWPLLATLLMGNEDAPVMYIATAVGGAGLVSPPDWRPQNSLYATLLDRVYQATQGTNRARGILWCQGETDVFNGVAYDEYLAGLLELADALDADLPGVSLLVGVLGGGALEFFDVESIRQAQQAAPDLRANVDPGPEYQGVPIDDPWIGLHFTSDEALREIAERWCVVLDSGWICALESFES